MNPIDKLLAFKKLNKFSEEAWEERGLNPSSDELCQKLITLFDLSTDKLIGGVQNNFTDQQLKAVIKSSLSLFKKKEYDTEERKFICDLFNELAKIVNVEIKDDLNKWLYGSILSGLFKIGNALNKESVIETISQPCTKCSFDLKTPILQKEKGIPESSWLIVKCDNCEELNLLALGPEIKRTGVGNYQWVQTLFKAEFDTYEKALIRLEQIKVFKR